MTQLHDLTPDSLVNATTASHGLEEVLATSSTCLTQ